ncbi:hypothetical protein B0H14DRAFT_2805099 [Mycena olivaceomarginata]|nr:hypothetical protein B0H14DRAFT_2805099 [Mycena olivaceomarginata]
MGMFKGVIKWPRKRLQEPGRPGSPVGTPRAAEPSQFPTRKNRFALFRKRKAASRIQGTSVVQSPPMDRRSLPLAATVAKILVIACDAPVVSFLKPIAGMLDFGCQKAQAVHSCEEAIQSLEQQAARVADMIQNSLDPEGMMPPGLDGILLILDEMACFLDDTNSKLFSGSTKPKLKFWIDAAQVQDRANTLSASLRDAVSVLGVASGRNGSGTEDAQARSCQHTGHTMPQQFRIDTSSRFAFFVYRAGVSWASSAAPPGQVVKLAEASPPSRI